MYLRYTKNISFGKKLILKRRKIVQINAHLIQVEKYHTLIFYYIRINSSIIIRKLRLHRRAEDEEEENFTADLRPPPMS